MELTAEYIAAYPYGELCQWESGECLRSATWEEYKLSIERREYTMDGELLQHGQIMVRGIACFVWTADDSE